MTDTLDALHAKPATVAAAPLLSVRNIEVVYDDVILVLRGLSLDVPKGCARRVVALAGQAGIELTPAGATHPHGNDPEDRTIRIAPSFPDLPEIVQAAEGVALCVLLAMAESSPAGLSRAAVIPAVAGSVPGYQG